MTGTIADARFPTTLPAGYANLTSIPAGNGGTGTLPALTDVGLTQIPDKYSWTCNCWFWKCKWCVW